MSVDHVVLRDRDDDKYPPSRVLTLTGVGPSMSGEPPLVVFEACAYDEDPDSATRTRLATFALDLDRLVNAINTAFGEVVVLLDQTGVEELSS